MTFGEKIKELRQNNNYSLYDLGEKVDVSHSYIDLIEKGKRRASKKVFERLMKVFYVKEDELTDLYMIETVPKNYLEKLKTIENSKSIEKINTQIKKLKIYGLVSAGNGVLIQEDIREKDFLLKEGVRLNSNSFVVIVHGDSMEPLFYDNDSILVDPTDCNDLRMIANKVVVIEINGEALVKKMKINGDYDLELQSLNPFYPPITIKEEDEARCIGVAVRIIDRDLNKVTL